MPATTIYIVRHAEKANNTSSDPPLSTVGQQRALALADTLHDDSVAALFATQYKRTKQTLQPLASVHNLEVQIYQPQKLNELAQLVKTSYATKTVVIAGHTNTVLETIAALGGERPIAALAETDYNYLFRINISADSSVTTQTFRYGN